MCPHIFFIEEKFQNSSHGVARRCLNGMHSCRNEDDGLVVPKLDDFLIAERCPLGNFKSFLSLMRRYDNKIYDPSFIAFVEYVVTKEYFPIFLVLLV